MTFDVVPYGVNVTTRFYHMAKDWYTRSGALEGCVGVLETAGKACTVVPVHLITAALLAPVGMIYDLVLGSFFLLANLCTGFTFDELRERLAGHCFSLMNAPLEIFKNLSAALCPPMAYRGEDAVNGQYALDYQEAYPPSYVDLADQLVRVCDRHPDNLDDYVSRDQLEACRQALRGR